MREITYTLLGDGTSDKALMPIIDWIIRQHFPDLLVQRQWADLSRLPLPPSPGSLTERIRQAIIFYPCDWLFVHRDAEKAAVSERREEIEKAWRNSGTLTDHKRVISVVPVRMTEAWLLFDELAIRKAASNPAGRQPITLPPAHTLEALPDPKQHLKHLLREASGLTGRRLQKFNESRGIQLVADYTPDYSPLRKLSAFSEFETSVKRLIETV